MPFPVCKSKNQWLGAYKKGLMTPGQNSLKYMPSKDVAVSSEMPVVFVCESTSFGEPVRPRKADMSGGS